MKEKILFIIGNNTSTTILTIIIIKVMKEKNYFERKKGIMPKKEKMKNHIFSFRKTPFLKRKLHTNGERMKTAQQIYYPFNNLSSSSFLKKKQWAQIYWFSLALLLQ